MKRICLIFQLILFASACGAPPSPRLTPIGPWRTTAGLHHPLVGRAFAGTQPIEPDALLARLRDAHFVLLGEQHDHPDHHRLQAWMLAALLRTGLRAVAFEMLDDDDRPAIPGAQDPLALAHAVGWAQSGWPDFELYLPVFQAIFSAEAPIVAAHPDRATLKSAMKDGLSGWPDTRIARLGLDRPLPDPHPAELAEEIRQSHCGHAPEAMVAAMITAQRIKDAWMAQRMAEAGLPAVLIAGNGHTRRDRGVPLYLPFHDPRPTLSVGLLPVDDTRRAPTDYALAAYDFVIFTPRESDQDPCERFKERLKKLSRPKEGVKSDG